MTKRQSQKWLHSMMNKYGTDEAGVREIMRERQRLSMAARLRKDIPHRGGFSDTELAKQAGRKGLESRWGSTQSSED